MTRMVETRWTPYLKRATEGRHGPEVDVEMRKDDFDEIRKMWAAAKELPADQLTARMLEIHHLMDIFALFPGSHFVYERERPGSNPNLGEHLKEEAMRQVEDAADPRVRACAEMAVHEAAKTNREVTADMVWERMTLHPSEPRMLGPVMKAAAASGWIAYTDRTVLSTMPQNHRRPIRVWLSLIYTPERTYDKA